uniref:Uncharacterized protein n=1 Tax=Aegilops tauschii TaxID=37682 RepID=M8BP63_AEGTA
MAPAMAAFMAAGEIGSALAKWSNIPDGFAKFWDSICKVRRPPVYCKKCKAWIAFRRYATHSKTHRNNEEAHLEDTEMTIQCPYKECIVGHKD